MGSGRLLFCLVLSLGLISIYCTSPPGALEVIDNLNDLKNKTDFNEYLSILCWLLRLGQIDQNGKLRLNINLADKPLGFHQFKNFEQTFPSLDNTNFEYYTFGNLIKALKSLRKYIVRKICSSTISSQNNLYRAVIRINKKTPNVGDKVYVTRHYKDMNKGSAYDPEFTLQISNQLLQKIQDLCLPIEEQEKFQRIRRKLQDYPHLHWLAYLLECETDNNANAHTKSQTTSKHSQVDNINLELKPNRYGQARIVWDGIPDEILSKELKIGVYRGEDEDDPLVAYPLNGRASGEIDTNLALICGLQLRLLEPVTSYESLYESSEFDCPVGKVSEETSCILTIVVGLLIIIIAVVTITKMSAYNRPSATPHFVTVSHGRPGF